MINLPSLPSLRRLRRQPGVATLAIATLAVAIGANTAVFSLLDTVALRPLPYPQPERLVHLGAAVPGLADLKEVSWPQFEALAAGSRTAVAFTAYFQNSFGLTDRERPEQLTGTRVSTGFFDVWKVQPVLGRTFRADEQRAGGPAVVVLGEAFWRAHYGSNPAIVGQNIDIEGIPTTVVGVVPDVLRFPFGDNQIWLPRPDQIEFMSESLRDNGAGYLQVEARLADGVSPAAAQEEIDRLSAAYKASRPGQYDAAYRITVVPMTERLIGSTRTTLLVLLAAVALVLLIACADVANLLLAEGLARRREFAARIALGAERRHILGQSLRESLLLATLGGAAGIALAYAGLRWLVASHPADLPRIADVTLSWRALAFSLLATTVAGVLAGLAPAWQTLRGDPKRFLVEAERAIGAGRRAQWSQGLLVSLQMALALVLFAAAGLLLRSLERVNGIALGFEPDRLLTVQVTLPEARHSGVAERRAFFDRILERARALPGVQAAGWVDYAPVQGAGHTRVTVDGAPPVAKGQEPLVLRDVVSEGYFNALGTRFLAGHDFDPHIATDAPLTVIVNRSAQRQLFGGEMPIGRRLRLRGGTVVAEIVGLVEDVQQDPLEAGKEPIVYLFQRQMGPDLSPPNFMNLMLRTDLPLASMASALQREVRALDPGQPLPEMTTMSALLQSATAQRKLTTGLFSAFSGLALLLSLLGIYGVVAHATALRRREIGLRMALGATPPEILAGVLRLGARWALPGIAVGMLGAYFVGRLIASQLFEVDPAGWRNVGVAAVLLAAAAVLACMVPARRALRVDPARALRLP